MAENLSSIELTQLPDEGVAKRDTYRVLARKYRPSTFSGLVGQDVLVRVFTNSFKSERIAHAFILTGVRGVGKTTTARIIARALNCIGLDGAGGLTTEPCGDCEHCKAISEDRHVDILEMDAASRTGVDDIRELIESVHYFPTSARYKVYIIDEVHMLSKNAFNALLKTLEEPPKHVKFIFATTEIKKVPITVLSRCQRFDLTRVAIDSLADLFLNIAEKERAQITKSAIQVIARAADGSVRDGLSLLDQAISQAQGEINEQEVRDILGVSDRSQNFHLLESIFSGDIKSSLETFDAQYFDGANPIYVFEDLLEIINYLTRLKVVPNLINSSEIPEIERTLGKALSERLSIASLTRSWQILLKGLSEISVAPSPKQAADMVLIRLTYTSNLPTPEEAISLFNNDLNIKPIEETKASSNENVSEGEDFQGAGPNDLKELKEPVLLDQKSKDFFDPQTFQEVLELADEKREAMLRTHLLYDVYLVSFEIGRIEFSLGPNAPKDLPKQLADFLGSNTKSLWRVIISSELGGVTLSEKQELKEKSLMAEVEHLPLVQAVMKTFPESTIEEFVKEKS